MCTPTCSIGVMDLLEAAMQVVAALNAKQFVKKLTDEELKVREANTFSSNRLKSSIEIYLKTRMGLNSFNSLTELFKNEPKGFVRVDNEGSMSFVNFYDEEDEDKDNSTTIAGIFHPISCQYDYEIDILRSILSHERFGEVILSIAGIAGKST